MVWTRVLPPLLKISSISRPSNLIRFSTSVETRKPKTLARKVIPVLIFSLTGGIGLSALDDLLIYHQCSSGPSKEFCVLHISVSGPQGTGIFQLKAVRHGDDSWFPYLGHRDWDILIMEALLHVPGNEEKHQTFRISLSDNIPLPASTECNDCNRSQESVSPEKK